MQTFTYSLMPKFLYRYGNIPATLLLFISATLSILGAMAQWTYILPAFIYIILIYIINRHFLKAYKYFPFVIEIDGTKMKCTNYLKPGKIVEINLSDIEKVEEGLFAGKPTRPIYITANNGSIKIGIYPVIKDFNQLLTKILASVNKKLYVELLDKITARYK